MGLRIVGAGQPRTGTESLKFALETLAFGARQHMLEVLRQPHPAPLWEAIAASDEDGFETVYSDCRAAVDFPAMAFWRTLVRRDPVGTEILTVRDAAPCYASLRNTVLKAARRIPRDDPASAQRRRLVQRVLLDGVFDGCSDDAEYMAGCFET